MPRFPAECVGDTYRTVEPMVSSRMVGGEAKAGDRRTSKIERLQRKYDLPELGERLEREWTGKAGERTSLRDLTDQVNRLVLGRAIAQTDLDLVDGEVDNYYRLLTDDDVSSGNRVEAETLLEQAGVDVSEILRDFVSHQSIYTYLTNDRDASLPNTEPRAQIENDLERLARVQGRLETLVQETVDRHLAGEDDDGRGYEVLLNVGLICEQCNREQDLETLLTEGGCECEESV